MELIVNGKHAFRLDDINYLPSVLSEMFITKIQYSSVETMKEYLFEIKELLIESQTVFDCKCARAIKNLENVLERKNLTREYLIQYFYDMILKSYGESTLPGFGYAKTAKGHGNSVRVNGKTIINPERTSTTEYDKILDASR